MTFELDETDARQFAAFYANEFGTGEAPHASNRVARAIAAQLTPEPFEVAAADTYFSVQRGPAGANLFACFYKRLPDAEARARALADELNLKQAGGR